MPLQNDYLREDKKQKKHLSIDQTILNPMEIFFSVWNTFTSIQILKPGF